MSKAKRTRVRFGDMEQYVASAFENYHENKLKPELLALIDKRIIEFMATVADISEEQAQELQDEYDEDVGIITEAKVP